MPSDRVLSKFKRGALHSGSKSGPIVKSKAQAVAIMLSEKRNEDEHGGQYHESKRLRVKRRQR